MSTTSILFVCLGNICRSPTAHGVFESLVSKHGLNAMIRVDSAGTAAYHEGSVPDSRSQEAAASRGFSLTAIRARQVSDRDFLSFDYILAMDYANLNELLRRCPRAQQHKVALFAHYSELYPNKEVPDPYYGEGNGFEHVLDMVEDAASGLLLHLKETLLVV